MLDSKQENRTRRKATPVTRTNFIFIILLIYIFFLIFGHVSEAAENKAFLCPFQKILANDFV